ncbi:MAG TPA: PQQ-like beta-propeller repeat protein [Sedimentisphaerales bacterium]|nr:PQQ-like beta-propeller repeat protein [Sedimentisphaerales bacterium]
MEEPQREVGEVLMTGAPPQIPANEPALGYRTARTTAKVAGVFSLVFLALLVANFIGTSVIGPRRENHLAAMKAALREGEATDEKLSEIRQLDLRIRRNRIWRLDFAHKTGHALLASIVVFFVAGKLARVLNKRLPRPEHAPDVGVEQIREARGARWTVTAGLVILGGIVALLVINEAPLAFVVASGTEPSPVAAVEPNETGPSYASMEEKRVQWHRFRGPGGGGVSLFTNIPTEWDGKTGKGIAWKSPVPLAGNNSPVVWNDRIFLSGATETKQEVYCYDAVSGRLLWTGDVPISPAVAAAELNPMEDTGRSASTMATDGRRVYTIFVTGDIAAFDFGGRRLWYKSLGVPDSAYGYASSLDTYEDRVIVQYDQGDGSEDKSRLYALDGASGRIVWEAKREVPNSWTSPIVVEVEGKPQLITLTDPWLLANNPADGAEIWRAECAGGDVAPSPIYAGGLVLAIEPYSHLIAIKPTGQGNDTETHVAWTMDEGGPDICSPVGNDQYVYLLEGQGLLICCSVADGKKVFDHDLRTDFVASPSIVGDKIYLLDAEGVMHIGQVGPEYKELAKCELGEKCHASPAFVDGRIYIRSLENLWCIGGPTAAGVAD